VADVLVNKNRINPVFELVGDKGMAKIVDLGVFDPGFLEIAVNAGTNVSNQQRMTGFGDKQVSVGNSRAEALVVLDGGSSQTV